MRRCTALAAVVVVVAATAALLLVRMRPRPGPATRATAEAEAAPAARAPAVMGMFYPSSPSALREEIQSCLSKVDVQAPAGELIALIVPHAGYSYSAPVAACAYRQVQGRSYDTVVVIGPSHRFPFSGAALSGIPQWLTPLGPVEVDRAATEGIGKLYPAAQVLDAMHDPEHSIEVQLPFLQVVLGQFKLAPILMSDFSDDNCRNLARAVADWAKGKSVLLAASSDMSHYPSHDDAVRVDRETLAAIETMDAAEVTATTKRLMSQGIAGLSTCLCGEGPIKTVLMAAKMLGADRAQVLKYANSGDAPRGPKAGVVGYGAVALYRNGSPQPEGALNREQQQRLLAIARQAIQDYVRNGHRSELSEQDPGLRKPGAAFVTLRKNGSLRGCIGSLEATKALAEDVRERAVMAAVADPRFSPVRPNELADLEIEMSVLLPLIRVATTEEIDISKHGVTVVSGVRRGMFLPQVARETGWSRDELLTRLCQEKAGLLADAWRNGAELYIFTVQAFSSPAPGALGNAGR